ncbi:mediator of RNA polymerase [Lipomyces arxii]|uniref:mediator of RNA polymerase n=1 Tax=Lipomyces arxii TaxID=56418 RepID=UPI0034CFA94A
MDGSAFPPPPEFDSLEHEQSKDQYTSFGLNWSVNDCLPLLNDIIDINNANNNNKIDLLNEIINNLLLKYLELVGIMSIEPEQFPKNVDEIRVLLINIHHILNQYRPHQARESVISLMESELIRKQSQIKLIRDACENAENVLNSVI